jgi:uncharacterized protein YdhG (YjbR/CyaY superfamily)
MDGTAPQRRSGAVMVAGGRAFDQLGPMRSDLIAHLSRRPMTFKRSMEIRHEKKICAKRMPKPLNVDAYIAAAPKELQSKTKELRAIIREAAPSAAEGISYGMPYHSYNGRLAYFHLSKAHIGLYIPTPVIEEHKAELKDYEAAKATVRFPLDKKLPVALIKKLVKARIKKNEAGKEK